MPESKFCGDGYTDHSPLMHAHGMTIGKKAMDNASAAVFYLCHNSVLVTFHGSETIE